MSLFTPLEGPLGAGTARAMAQPSGFKPHIFFGEATKPPSLARDFRPSQISMELSRRPAVSPAGNFVAFLLGPSMTDGRFWVLRSFGTVHNLTRGSAPNSSIHSPHPGVFLADGSSSFGGLNKTLEWRYISIWAVPTTGLTAEAIP